MSANPLFWLHFRLTGAWRNNLTITIAYVALFSLGAAVAYQMTAKAGWGGVSSGCLVVVTVVQAAVALLLAPAAIRKAVLRDFQSGMIESHRLSPMSGARIIGGYMTGPPVQVACLFGASLLMGTSFAVHVAQQLSPLVLSGWYVLQLSLLCLAFMVAALSLLIALGTAGKTDVLTIGVLVVVFGGWAVVPFVPGVALVTGVISGGLVGQMLFGGGTPAASGSAASIVTAAAGQVVFGLVFLWAASRKVRSPERAMFGMGLGLLLAAIWATTLVVGVAAMPTGHWLTNEYGDIAIAQLVTSTGTLMLVALFALTGAAVERFHVDRTLAFGAPTKLRRRRVTLLIPLVLGLLAAVTLVLMYEALAGTGAAGSLGQAFTSRKLRAAMLIALVLSSWTDFTLIYFAVSRGMRLFRWLILCTVVLKLLPVLVDLGGVAASEEFGESSRYVDMYFAGLSPIGTLILCMSYDGNPWPGLLGQVALAAGTTWLAWQSRRVLLATIKRSPCDRTSGPA